MAALPIQSLEARLLRIPFSKPISSSLGTYDGLDCVLAYLHTENGPTGLGFTMFLGGYSGKAILPFIENELAPLVAGQDALAPGALWSRMWAPNKAKMRGGIALFALSAVDIACWDIMGKAAGLPLNRLLGGDRQRVPVYGSGGWHSLSDAELVAECQAFAGMGLSAYKLKIGTSCDRERIALLRREMGDDFTLLADANQKYNVREAVEVSRLLAEFGVAWFEEPVLADSIDDLAEVARKSEVPIAAGENAYYRWGFREICERRAAAILQPDIGRCGGVTEFVKIGHLADAYNLSLASHLLHEISISLVGAFPSGDMAEYMELLPEGTLTREFAVAQGCIDVPDVPGHGVEFTQRAIERYRVA